MRHNVWISCLALLGASCVHSPPESESLTASAHHDRLAFVQAACGGCHAVEGEAISPNPLSPTFAAIANRPGLNEQTLSSWLRDAHNYPEVMDFDLSDEQVDMVAAHMLTLRDPAWRPLPE
ncbi:MAG: hypothetical protein A3J40_10920 [Erythrobacter sp. RIFCSPHIGHO2_12_FULL_63_10]|nr:MAG: hypothetical protein A3J40_10920 [Erythrobacter sp. RIFCSPHIGHO2_12_FULL_63_10]